MRSFQLSRFFSLLVITAVVVVTFAWMKDLIIAVLFLAFELSDRIMPPIVKRGTRRRGWVL